MRIQDTWCVSLLLIIIPSGFTSAEELELSDLCYRVVRIHCFVTLLFVQGGPKSKPAYFWNNFGYCLSSLIIIGKYALKEILQPEDIYIASAPDTVCVTSLPCKILITTLARSHDPIVLPTPFPLTADAHGLST